MIEFDLIMLKIMDIYEIQKTEMKAHLQYLFFAADVKPKITIKSLTMIFYFS